MTGKVALVTGVGPGTGSAIVRRFAEGGYRVAMIARSTDRLAALQDEIPGACACPADVTDATAMNEAITRIEHEIGAPEVVIHNAVGGVFGKFQDIDPDVLERNFKVNVM